MTTTPQFRAVYETEGVYEQLLLPHHFGGLTDTELVADWMAGHHDQPAAALRIAEFGCGTGRITTALAPYARELVLADYSDAMISAVTPRFPTARTMVADTRDAVSTLLLDEQRAAGFDLVASFWSISYPIGEFFETMTPGGELTVSADPVRARARAAAFVAQLLELLAPGGHLLIWLFDSESPEQRLVTRGWEKVAPFPEGGRAYTRTVLLDALLDAEARGRGSLTHTRMGGVAVAPNKAAGRGWFFGEHFKHHPRLVADHELVYDVEEFLDRYTLPDGRVAIPSGAHIVDFHAAAHPYSALPEACS